PCSTNAARSFRAAVGFAGYSMLSYDRALHALSTWLDSWPGIGNVAVDMHRQGFDLQLTQYDERGWRATFYTTGMEHSPTSTTGTRWEKTSWHATNERRGETLRRSDSDGQAASTCAQPPNRARGVPSSYRDAVGRLCVARVPRPCGFGDGPLS